MLINMWPSELKRMLCPCVRVRPSWFSLRTPSTNYKCPEYKSRSLKPVCGQDFFLECKYKTWCLGLALLGSSSPPGQPKRCPGLSSAELPHLSVGHSCPLVFLRPHSQVRNPHHTQLLPADELAIPERFCTLPMPWSCQFTLVCQSAKVIEPSSILMAHHGWILPFMLFSHSYKSWTRTKRTCILKYSL